MVIMSYAINCPFCNEYIVSDVCAQIEDVNGEYQCNNGHTFTLEFIRKIDTNSQVNKDQQN